MLFMLFDTPKIVSGGRFIPNVLFKTDTILLASGPGRSILDGLEVKMSDLEVKKVGEKALL